MLELIAHCGGCGMPMDMCDCCPQCRQPQQVCLCCDVCGGFGAIQVYGDINGNEEWEDCWKCCGVDTEMLNKIKSEMSEAETKAVDALSRYKFQMFGYWAAIWVHLNRLSGLKKPNPFRPFVHAARSAQQSDSHDLPKDIVSFISDIATNWDCDEDGHKYGTGCRMCAAHELMNKYKNGASH